MNPLKVVVVDYGIGNLFSVKRSLEYVGANVILSNQSDEILNADRLVLPGVGAFGDGMAGIKKQSLATIIQKFALSDKPLLGICLGMQMLATKSFEFGENSGLDIIPGEIIPIPNKNQMGIPHKIPHIGWANLSRLDSNSGWQDTILKNLSNSASCYHIHSFMFVPQIREHAIAVYDYNGISIASVVRKGNVYGCQFHPEKSGEVGLNVLKSFIEL
jgi:imidazole glycerol-phosphate synthase subunit HisH